VEQDKTTGRANKGKSIKPAAPSHKRSVRALPQRSPEKSNSGPPLKAVSLTQNFATEELVKFINESKFPRKGSTNIESSLGRPRWAATMKRYLLAEGISPKEADEQCGATSKALF
jgi:hypothetical protein